MTTTGAERVKALFPERVRHCYLPYDLPIAVRGFLDQAHPQLAIILETELWPNLLHECRQRRIPIIVASARISPRTANRYRRLASLFRAVLSDGVTIAAQTEADAERFKTLGAVDVHVTGNIKFDIDISEHVRATGQALRRNFGERFVWIAGSTHAGEEAAALQTHRDLLNVQRDSLLIIAPRHPQRFDEVRDLLIKSGLLFVTRSSGSAVTVDTSVLLLDAMGELLGFYAAADLAFVGGSLIPVGGHNLLEPAALGVPALCGPHMFAAQDVADRLVSDGAARSVESAAKLASCVLALAADQPQRLAMGKRGLAAIVDNRGAVERTMTLIAARSSV